LPRTDFTSLFNRVAEWEKRWQAGDTGWDHGEPSPPLLEYLASNLIDGQVLVPGCGSGHDVRALARGGSAVLGLDIAPSALTKAHRFPPVGKERYELGNWLKPDPELKERFDWVVEHTCFCALEPSARAEYVASVDFALRPGGQFLGIFYLRPRAENGPPFGVKATELDAFFSRFELKRQWTPSRAYPGREGREQMRAYYKSA
jgi:SAM-dependent methyltransferase|tara:strand:- start:25638 stop:26246 length:609 start_codon:yes stop_codon:yes gene_type:complete